MVFFKSEILQKKSECTSHIHVGKNVLSDIRQAVFFNCLVLCGLIEVALSKFIYSVNFFPFVSKKYIGSGQKYPGQGRVGTFFTAGQKYARVGPGPISIHDRLYRLMWLSSKVKACKEWKACNVGIHSEQWSWKEESRIKG